MLNTSFNGSGGRVKAEDVISKLKDDGDFDRLRRKIIRKLKEELRSNIISMVKQSVSLSRPGAESMKPRQLSDAIHQEIGDKLMNQISDGLWNIIRSADGMQPEIKETVQSVYDKLSNPEGKVNAVGTLTDEELNDPPGFGPTERRNKDQMNQTNNIGRPNRRKRKAIEENKGDKSQLEDLAEPDNLDYGAPPGFSSVLKHKHSVDASDEDPDVPPGFG
ncbi:uncharacterized protein LOC130994623 isoform X2 [Salvia miltiorrhiza]|uniref:uncharacterized protein LOC130994623 isoform X2 n=1 Tax=Salvia miltiorrhiza TaxID=226208 RepID=UPI0025ABFC06|nr:uncharacterized protein LOC130994623 isoform X2 [Salvia miltiorrhiza]